jgi:hypothetical protein
MIITYTARFLVYTLPLDSRMMSTLRRHDTTTNNEAVSRDCAEQAMLISSNGHTICFIVIFIGNAGRIMVVLRHRSVRICAKTRLSQIRYKYPLNVDSDMVCYTKIN